jgi:hypothetical protein
MPTKLDQTIARVAVAYGRSNSRLTLTATAGYEVASIAEGDWPKLPDRHSKCSAKQAGAADLSDGWDVIWFHAVLELLLAGGERGKPGLKILWERDTFSYPHLVFPALLRVIVRDGDDDGWSEMISRRLMALNYPFVFQAVSETLHQAAGEPGLSDLLGRFAAIEVTNGDGETIGMIVERQRSSLENTAG